MLTLTQRHAGSIPALRAMSTIEIDRELIDELISNEGDTPSNVDKYGQVFEGWINVQTDRGDEHRWYFDMTTVITQDSETFYAFDWVDDKGEMGDLTPLEYTNGATSETITARQVKPVTKVVVEYINV